MSIVLRSTLEIVPTNTHTNTELREADAELWCSRDSYEDKVYHELLEGNYTRCSEGYNELYSCKDQQYWPYVITGTCYTYIAINRASHVSVTFVRFVSSTRLRSRKTSHILFFQDACTHKLSDLFEIIKMRFHTKHCKLFLIFLYVHISLLESISYTYNFQVKLSYI